NLHRIANGFVDAVAAKLKAMYPAKIKVVIDNAAKIPVNKFVSVNLESNGGQLTLTYTATLVRCAAEEAEYHFDHRGAMSASVDKSGAVADARARRKQEIVDVYNKFLAAYGKDTVHVYPKETVPVMHSDGMWWVVLESFIVAGPTDSERAAIADGK